MKSQVLTQIKANETNSQIYRQTVGKNPQQLQNVNSIKNIADGQNIGDIRGKSRSGNRRLIQAT